MYSHTTHAPTTELIYNMKKKSVFFLLFRVRQGWLNYLQPVRDLRPPDMMLSVVTTPLSSFPIHYTLGQ